MQCFTCYPPPPPPPPSFPLPLPNTYQSRNEQCSYLLSIISQMRTSYLPWLHILTVSYQIACLLSTPVDGPLKNCLVEEKLIFHSACIISPQNKFHLDVLIMGEIFVVICLSIKCQMCDSQS